MHTSIRVAGLITLVGLAGCATTRATVNSYVDPNHGSGDVSSVAIFPMRNARLAPSEAQQLNRKIAMGLQERSSELAIMSPAQTVNLLNEAELADEWADFLNDYVTSGVPNAQTLRQIGDALGVEAIIQGEVVSVVQEDGAFGWTKGSTRVTVRYSMLGVNSGRLLWECSSDGICHTATTIGSAPPVIKAIQAAVDKIVQNLP